MRRSNLCAEVDDPLEPLEACRVDANEAGRDAKGGDSGGEAGE